MYVPVMKNRTVEVGVLQQLSAIGVFDDNVIPLIELVQKKTRNNNKNTFIQDLTKILSDAQNMRIMVDFYKSTKLRTTTDAIREYITVSMRQCDFGIKELQPLYQYQERVIPVISYLSENLSLNRMDNEVTAYRRVFSQLAFRVKVQEFEQAFSYVETKIRSTDYLILDIESSSHMSPVFKKIYRRIAESKKIKGFTSVIINANRPESLANKDMIDGEPIAEIDNSLKELYSSAYMNKFDGFGDYAGISASLPSTGGAISPVGIYYSNENNYFIAYKGRAPQLSEFPLYIAPQIVNSEYWKEYGEAHHKKCPGCLEIEAIVGGIKSGRNQAQWKMITMLHYIYTMYEVGA